MDPIRDRELSGTKIYVFGEVQQRKKCGTGYVSLRASFFAFFSVEVIRRLENVLGIGYATLPFSTFDISFESTETHLESVLHQP